MFNCNKPRCLPTCIKHNYTGPYSPCCCNPYYSNGSCCRKRCKRTKTRPSKRRHSSALKDIEYDLFHKKKI